MRVDQSQGLSPNVRQRGRSRGQRNNEVSASQNMAGGWNFEERKTVPEQMS